MPLLTIFTPTYNRAHILDRLYESLKRQDCADYCWLIVDDGSTDNTKDLVNQWQAENKVSITYHKQENSGKSQAHNTGVALTQTELFVCVDSDDYLTCHAVSEIKEVWKNHQNSDTGILFGKTTEEQKVTIFPRKELLNENRATLRDAYDKHGLHGDTMLVFRTSTIKRFAFPKFDGEKFVPEAYLYDLIDQYGTLIVCNKYLYVCEYQQDGYTNNMAKLLAKNPQGYLAFIQQRINLDSSFSSIFWDTVRYVSMALVIMSATRSIKNARYPVIAILALLPGFILYKIKFHQYA